MAERVVKCGEVGFNFGLDFPSTDANTAAVEVLKFFEGSIGDFLKAVC